MDDLVSYILQKFDLKYLCAYISIYHKEKISELGFTPIPKKGNAKECLNYHTITLISHTSKIMLKILQARLQQYVNSEFPDVQAGFRKGRGTRNQIVNVGKIIKKARKFQKSIYFCFIDYTKTFDCGSQQTVGNF